MNDKHIDDLINQALHDDAQLPEGLSNRLEQYIDELAAGDHQKKTKHVKIRTLYWLAGVAASLLIGIAIFFQTEKIDMRPTTADTFSSPEEAAQAAQAALAFLSVQLNKGLDQASEAKSEVEKVNKIVNKQIKELDTQEQP